MSSMRRCNNPHFLTAITINCRQIIRSTLWAASWASAVYTAFQICSTATCVSLWSRHCLCLGFGCIYDYAKATPVWYWYTSVPLVPVPPKSQAINVEHTRRSSKHICTHYIRLAYFVWTPGCSISTSFSCSPDGCV